MPFETTPIKDLLLFKPQFFEDSRGYFFESYNKKVFVDAGLDINFVQDNQSYSRYGTIRGLHYQKGDSAQNKLIRVLEGKILDVAVDLRTNSQTFGKVYIVELSFVNQLQVFIPKGFAHGFSVLSETATIFYKCDEYYDPSSEAGILYNDLHLNIDWRVRKDKQILSAKDLHLESFQAYKDNPCF